MRSKRIQKRKSKLPPPPQEYQGLLDPFSANNPELVEDEVSQEGWCPCCVDRMAEIELNKLEGEYLALYEQKEKP